MFGVPDADLHLLAEVDGLDVVELGCGTAYVSAWLLRRGARSVTGVDNSSAQLGTARAMQREFRLAFPDEDGLPAGDRLLRDHFGMHRFQWPEDDSVEFHIGHGDWIRLLRANGFEVENLVEVRPREGASTRYPYVTLEWARRWPCEEVWVARRHR
jgi:SAM-dependent methyltransferase